MKKCLLTAGVMLFVAGTVVAQPVAAPAKPATDQPAADKDKAEAKKLLVGDKAPALTIEKWVKGAPVTGFEKGKTYVVEFWATWCGPCIASMPHLSEIQKEYKDKGVTVIGVASEEWNQELDGVQDMVKEKADKMAYTVGWDTGKTNQAYMKAAGQNGIPTSFVVNGEGVVAYIGHPMGLDKPLEQIVAGTYDLKGAAEKFAKAAENEAKMRPLQAKLNKAMRAKDWDGALGTIDEIVKLDPDSASTWESRRFTILLTGKKDTDAAYALGRKLVDGAAKDDSMTLNMIAWTIVDPKGGIEKKDLDLAMKAAARADELTKHKDAAILDTLARVHWIKGEKAKAIEVQKKAVELAEGEMGDELRETLDEYQKPGGKD